MLKGKIHLSSLPDLAADQVPQRTTQASKRGIVLLPLFEGYPEQDAVASHVAISAVWAWRSWLQHTDANEYGVEVKFYVEEKVRDSAMPILERNFVEERDIIWYSDGLKLEGVIPAENGWHTGGIKKAASYTDWRFQEYDWIFDVDSDIFIMSPNRETYPFFRNFFENCEDNTIGVSWINHGQEGITPYELWCQDKPDDYVSGWKSRFETLSNRNMLESYFDPETAFMTCNGGIVALPAKHLMSYHRTTCEFLVRASRDLLDLEAALSLYSSLGNPIFSLYKTLDILTHNMRDSTIEEVRRFFEKCSEGNPFLLHYFSSHLINNFYQGIGIFDD